MTDYSSLGSFATGGASSLNGTLIQKLYDAESKSKVAPIDASLKLWDTEQKKIGEIHTKVNELLATVRPLDFFSTDNNAFDQISATSTGDSAVFDASDTSALKVGTTNVSITQLAQKDSYQSVSFSTSTDLIDGGQDSGDKITINGTDFSTEGKSYADLVQDINQSGTIDASIEQISDTDSRIVIKSQDVGESNALSISQTGVDLGLEDDSNHVLTAQNLNATVDGVSYDLSSNSVTVNGNLKITATKVGDASLSVQKDESAIIPAVQKMATKYNELVSMITEETSSSTSSVQDKSALKSIVNTIKDMMYQKYGINDSNLLNNGFSFDKTGLLTVDTTTLDKALTDDPDKIKDLFIGVPEDKGFGTMLKETLDNLNSYNGLFTTYSTNMDQRKTKLEDDKKQAVKDLDTKYDTMAAQFAAYGSVITQMESSFGGLKMMIEQSSASK